ncbi:MAG: metalloregulator ArsR/SmtB family transcription factor [Parvularculaceae bacterium]
MAKPKDIEGLKARAGEVAGLLKTLSHANRLLIACQLMSGEQSVSEIEARACVRQPVLSRDLARLRAAGLVVARRESKRVFYRIADERLVRLMTSLCEAISSPAPAKSTGAPIRRPGKKRASAKLSGPRAKR